MERISIIGGTGALGSALARRLLLHGREVIIGSRDPAKAEMTASELGSMASGAGLYDAACQGAICFATVPYSAHAATLASVKPALAGKILVDATVPLLPPKVGTVQLPKAGSAAIEAAAILGEDVRVVSALQNIGAEKLGSEGEIDADVLVCGDDRDSVEQVRDILAAIGLRSWHAGPLANSAAAEAMTSVLIQINRRYKMEQAGFRITGKPKEMAV
jgi:NADPH-dependent F420 reductase